jgi:type IV pilus assembly protein PilQ
VALVALTSGARALHAQAPADAPRITLQLSGADIRDALRLVAKQGGVNLVLSNAVGGNVTLELEQTTLKETLDAIVHVGGFEYTIEGDIVTVSTLAELIERERQRQELEQGRASGSERRGHAPEVPQVLVLHLRYVDAERVRPVIETLVSEAGSVSLLMTSDHVARSNAGAGARQPYPQQVEGGLQIGTRLSTSSQGQPAKSHTLVVIDVPERLERIREVVKRIDVEPVQVLIESRFVEIALDDESRLGIDWNAVAGAAGAASPHTFPFLFDSLGSADPNVSGGSPGSIFPPAPNSVTTPGEPGLFTFGTLDFTSFTAVLRMIQRDTRVQLVSNPRIVVDDRHTATILIGERYPILSANISEFGTVTEQLDHYEPIGVQLEVTPSVLSDGEIELIVRPSTSSLGPEVEGSTGLTVTRINARQIDTTVTARNSETIVLGGLITTRDSEEESRVPFLSSVPLLGRLFRHTSKSSEKVELVVFLTVTIVEPGGLSLRERRMFEDALDGGDRRSELEFTFSNPRH